MGIREEKTLLEWGSYNVLSVLKDEKGQRYLSYLLSIISDCYMTTKVSTEDLIGLLECKISPRDVLTRNSLIWFSNGNPGITMQIPLSFLSEDLLPYENICFENPTPWKDYLEDLKKEKDK